jgi:3-methyladenine DNA glycosylase/8-oxoguanine DNA glycosylase
LQKTSEEELRALKVGYRAKTIKKIDNHFANDEMDESELRSKDLETQ